MTMPRFRLRTLLIAIAALAFLLAVSIPVVRLVSMMEEFYGPGGILERESAIQIELAAGHDALARHRPAEAEARFRTALEVIGRNVGFIPVDTGRSLFREKFEASAGLADALAAQGRHAEALTVDAEALASLETGLGDVAPTANILDYPGVAELRKRQADCQKALGQGAVGKGK